MFTRLVFLAFVFAATSCGPSNSKGRSQSKEQTLKEDDQKQKHTSNSDCVEPDSAASVALSKKISEFNNESLAKAKAAAKSNGLVFKDLTSKKVLSGALGATDNKPPVESKTPLNTFMDSDGTAVLAGEFQRTDCCNPPPVGVLSIVQDDKVKEISVSGVSQKIIKTEAITYCACEPVSGPTHGAYMPHWSQGLYELPAGFKVGPKHLISYDAIALNITYTEGKCPFMAPP